MKKKETADVVRSQLIGLLIAFAVSALIYMFAMNFLVTIFYHDQYGERNMTPMFISLVVIFQIGFWIGYTRKTSREFAVVRKETFSWKEDFLETLRGEGKPLLVIMGALAVIFEGAMLLDFQPVVTALSFSFSLAGLAGLISVPVLRTVIAYAVTMALIFFQLVWQHYRDFRRWTEKEK